MHRSIKNLNKLSPEQITPKIYKPVYICPGKMCRLLKIKTPLRDSLLPGTNKKNWKWRPTCVAGLQ